MKGKRADVRLVELGLAESREKAQALIMGGCVTLDGKRINKSGEAVPDEAALLVHERSEDYASRAAYKLKKAAEKYQMELEGVVAMDVGASNGGFTDYMLRAGAKRIYAIDVGYGQLALRLRDDPRVTVMDRTNARQMEPSWFPETPDFATMDVSFISIKLILPAIYACLGEHARAVVLVKPQFEVGRGKVGKSGVVRDKKLHCEVLAEAASFAADCGFMIRHLDFSPITGAKGNIEFLMVLEKGASEAEGGGFIAREAIGHEAIAREAIGHEAIGREAEATVEEAHRELSV